MLVDFHMHSTASDGVMRPLDLRAANKAAGIKMMSLTDHDTIDGFMTMLKEPDLALLTKTKTFISSVMLLTTRIKN